MNTAREQLEETVCPVFDHRFVSVKVCPQLGIMPIERRTCYSLGIHNSPIHWRRGLFGVYGKHEYGRFSTTFFQTRLQFQPPFRIFAAKSR